MRVVIDTNLIISGLLWSGVPHQALEIAAGKRVVITSEVLIDELRDVLHRKRFDKFIKRIAKEPEDLVAEYLQYATIIEPALIPEDAVRDAKDVKVLAAAVGGSATHIVTGDDDLLTLKTYADIQIMTSREFVTHFREGQAE